MKGGSKNSGKRSGVRNLGFSVDLKLLLVRRSQVCTSLSNSGLNDVTGYDGSIYTKEISQYYTLGLIY